MLRCAGSTALFHPKPHRAAHGSLRWPCRGRAGTSTEDARGAETSSWVLLLQSGWPRIMPLQGFAALLRQCSCLQLFLLMLLPARPAVGPLHSHVCQKSPPSEAPGIGFSPTGRYLQAAAAVSSFLFSCPNHQKPPQQHGDPRRSLQSRRANTTRAAGLHF